MEITQNSEAKLFPHSGSQFFLAKSEKEFCFMITSHFFFFNKADFQREWQEDLPFTDLIPKQLQGQG